MSARWRMRGGRRRTAAATGAPARPAPKGSVAFLVWRDTTHPEGGGSELYVERMARHLVAAGYDVTIAAAAHPGAPTTETREGVRIRRHGGRLGVYLGGLGYLIGPGRGVDVVVDVQNGLPFFSPLVRRRGIVNLVHHVHREQWQIIFPGRVGRAGWWIESRLAPWLYRRHRYVTVSEATRGELVGLGVGADRIDIVPNGLDDPCPVARAEREDRPTVCVLGRLVPHKQVEHALEAVARARPLFPELRLEVVGEGWWHDALTQRAAELGVSDAVTFHGRVSNEVRDEILDRSWLLLAPSVKEGWGIAIMEAAAHGVPAIAYRSAGGVCESILDGETGWLVDDQDELQKRLEELLLDPSLRGWMEGNARVHADRYSWAESGQRFTRVIAAARRG